MTRQQGILLLVSGPSGTGKTTLCRKAQEQAEAYYAISCTTRAPREGEVHGKDYYFLTEEEFQDHIKQQRFIEYAKVHNNYYGTLKSEILALLNDAKDVVMDIDVQGAQSIRSCEDETIQKSLVDLFIMPPNEQELLNRLNGRGRDSEEVIQRRMKNALEEMKHWKEYSYCLLSGNREEDYKKFLSLLYAERLRVSRTLPYYTT